MTTTSMRWGMVQIVRVGFAKMQSEFLGKVQEEKKNLKLIEIGPGEQWTDFLEQANGMF